MSNRLAGKRGGARLRLIVALLLTAGVILAVVRVVPVYIKTYEFEEAVRNEAKFAGVRNTTPMEIRQRLYQRAQQLMLTSMQPEQIQVVPARGGGVRISVDYSVPVQLIGYTLTLNFQASADTATAY